MRKVEPPTADAFVHGLNARVLHCRELGHVWRPSTVTHDTSARVYDRRLRCTSCHTVRVQILSERGHVVGNRYVYPDGYLASGVEGIGQSRDLFRLEAVQRFLEAGRTMRAVS